MWRGGKTKMMKKCPNCTSLMPSDVARCIRCGFDSPAQMTAAAAGGALVAPAAAPVKQGRLRNGWALARESLRVLRKDRKLLLFPLLSGIASVLVFAMFMASVFASGAFDENGGVQTQATGWLFVFLYYCVNYLVIVFFNSALVGCAMIRFRGGSPSVGDGLRVARARLGQIVAWALFAASVGVLLQFIAERVGFIGKIVIAILGAAWTVATYFVVPVLVVEKLGPLDAARRSAAIVKKAWGESLASNSGIGLVTTLLTLLVIMPLGVASIAVAIQMQSIAVAVAGLGLLVLGVVFAALVSSALSSIALCALYLYATEGKVPRAFADTGLQHAFATKK